MREQTCASGCLRALTLSSAGEVVDEVVSEIGYKGSGFVPGGGFGYGVPGLAP